MGIFSRKKRPKVRSEPDAVSPMMMEAAGSSTDGMMAASEAMSAAAGRIANTLAMASLRLYKGNEPQGGHDLDRLVYYAPGPGLTPYTFKRDMELHRCTAGRAYAWIERARDGVTAVALHVLDPMRVVTMRVRETGDIWHEVAVSGQSERVMVPDMDMLNLNFLSNGRRSRPADVLRGTLQYDAEIKETSLMQLRGVHDTIVVEAPNELSKEKRMKMIQEMVSVYNSTGKAALLMDSGMKATHMAGAAVDPKVLDVEKVTKTRVATVYGIPPHLLGAADSVKGASEEIMMEFLQLAVMPPMAQWEDELNKKLLTYRMVCEGLRFRFDRDALVLANTDAKTKMYHSGIRDGWMRPNEVRRRQGLPDDENGDQLMMSRDMIPIRINTEQPELLLTGGRGAVNNE